MELVFMEVLHHTAGDRTDDTAEDTTEVDTVVREMAVVIVLLVVDAVRCITLITTRFPTLYVENDEEEEM